MRDGTARHVGLAADSQAPQRVRDQAVDDGGQGRTRGHTEGRRFWFQPMSSTADLAHLNN